MGAGFALLGLVFIAYGVARQRSVEAALREGRFAPLDSRVGAALGVGGLVLALLTLALVVVEL